MWERENDPCPTGWRVPTSVELTSLINSGSVWGIYNGMSGRLFGSAPHQIFLPVAGARFGFQNGILGNTGFGFYGSNRLSGREASIVLQFHLNSVNTSSFTHANASSIRCVEDVTIAVNSVTVNQTNITLFADGTFGFFATVQPLPMLPT